MKNIDMTSAKGLQVISGLKTNRVLVPQGIRTTASAFSDPIQEADTHLVTVGQASYPVYRYEGNRNGIANAVVLLTGAGRSIWAGFDPSVLRPVHRCFPSG